MPDTTPTRSPSSKHRATLNALGVIILLLGLAVAGIIYWNGHARSARQSSNQTTSRLEGGWQDTSLSREDSKRSNRDIEMYYGKIGMLSVRLQDWFTEPASLAIIIATISTLTALALFLFANRLR
jgi:flagellar basal body-associated protein FliL